ncbi:MAG: hypothetical protein ACRC17_04735 [Culicoidibacterales bacterium]
MMIDELEQQAIEIFQSYFSDELASYLADPKALALFSEVEPVETCSLSIDRIELKHVEVIDEYPVGQVEMTAQLLVNDVYAMVLGLRFENIELLDTLEDPLYPMIKQTVNQNLFDSVIQGLKQLDKHVKKTPTVLH